MSVGALTCSSSPGARVSEAEASPYKMCKPERIPHGCARHGPWPNKVRPLTVRVYVSSLCQEPSLVRPKVLHTLGD